MLQNLEQKKGYRETDILGGIDPCSASKASAEILFHSYYKTFIQNKKNNIRICTAEQEMSLEEVIGLILG